MDTHTHIRRWPCKGGGGKPGNTLVSKEGQRWPASHQKPGDRQAVDCLILEGAGPGDSSEMRECISVFKPPVYASCFHRHRCSNTELMKPLPWPPFILISVPCLCFSETRSLHYCLSGCLKNKIRAGISICFLVEQYIEEVGSMK